MYSSDKAADDCIKPEEGTAAEQSAMDGARERGTTSRSALCVEKRILNPFSARLNDKRRRALPRKMPT